MNVLINADNGDSIYLLPFLKDLSHTLGKKVGYVFCRSDADATTHFSKKRQLLEELLYEQPYLNLFGFIDKEYGRKYFYNRNYMTKDSISNIFFNKNDQDLTLTLKNNSDDGCGAHWVQLNNYDCNYVDAVPNFYFNNLDLETFYNPLCEIVRRRFSDLGRSYTEKWLTINEHNPLHNKKIAIGRSARYNQNCEIPKKLVDILGRDNFIFVGLPEEHKMFCANVCDIDFFPTDNLLQVAQVLNTVDLYIGNQSCIMAIAEGLKKDIIQEAAFKVPNCNFSNIRNNFFLATIHEGELKFLQTAGIKRDVQSSFNGIDLSQDKNIFDLTVRNQISSKKLYFDSYSLK